mmetsp:Transcript_3569/g.6736  ORF Transcript_3569/g.6736 Transcript_3569/m.6736 type:complete len:107 (-) Transcript_3569:267-587(-)
MILKFPPSFLARENKRKRARTWGRDLSSRGREPNGNIMPAPEGGTEIFRGTLLGGVVLKIPLNVLQVEHRHLKRMWIEESKTGRRREVGEVQGRGGKRRIQETGAK